MCRDTIRDGSYCGHQQHYYGQYGNHFRRVCATWTPINSQTTARARPGTIPDTVGARLAALGI
jgi:hypothetical protein